MSQLTIDIAETMKPAAPWRTRFGIARRAERSFWMASAAPEPR